jgi:hypothetical protein
MKLLLQLYTAPLVEIAYQEASRECIAWCMLVVVLQIGRHTAAGGTPSSCMIGVCFLNSLSLLLCVCRWEAGQRLYMKLLLQLYTAAAGAAASTPLAERCAAAGGVPAELVAAYKAVLTDEKLDGSFKVRVDCPVYGDPLYFWCYPSFFLYVVKVIRCQGCSLGTRVLFSCLHTRLCWLMRSWTAASRCVSFVTIWRSHVFLIWFIIDFDVVEVIRCQRC